MLGLFSKFKRLTTSVAHSKIEGIYECTVKSITKIVFDVTKMFAKTNYNQEFIKIVLN